MGVVIRVSDNGHIFVVLGRGPDKCWPANIDIFNCFFQCHIFFRYRFTEGIQIDSYQVDKLYILLLCLCHMLNVIPQAQQGAMDPGMQCLYPAVHHFRKTSYVRDIPHDYTCFTQ